MIVNETFFPLAGTEVEYYGQDVAYVIAETYEQARQASTLVRVDYTPGTPVTTQMASKLKSPREGEWRENVSGEESRWHQGSQPTPGMPVS